MNIPQNIRDQYDIKNGLIVISSYPKKGEVYSGGVDAVASYAKNTVLALKKQDQTRKIIILSPVIKDEINSFYIEDDILVIRCFKRNSLTSLFALVRVILGFRNISTVMVEFEFSTYGDTKITIIFPLILAIISLNKKKIILVLHQVVLDLSTLSGHIGISHNKFKVLILNLFLKKYYQIISFPAQTIVVLEDVLKKRLATIINHKKIQVIYHGIDQAIRLGAIEKNEARKRLKINKKDYVLLYFGYITWYKGADFFVKSLLDQKSIGNRNLKVIIAGGLSATQSKKKHYIKFYRNVCRLAGENIEITGFIDEKKLALYLSASDLLVFPYRTFMSSSGAFATAIAFQKPFLVSTKLKDYFRSEDICSILKGVGLSFNDFSFRLNKDSFQEKLQLITKNNTIKKISNLSKNISEARDFNKNCTII